METQIHTSGVVCNLTSNGELLHCLAKHEITTAIVELAKSDNAEVRRRCAIALANLTSEPKAHEMMASHKCIDGLLDLCRDAPKDRGFLLARAFLNLSFTSAVCNELCDENVVEVLSELSRRDNGPIRKAVAVAFSNLTTVDSSHKPVGVGIVDLLSTAVSCFYTADD